MRTSHLQRASHPHGGVVAASWSDFIKSIRAARDSIGHIQFSFLRGGVDERVAVGRAYGPIVTNKAGGFAILHVNNEKWRARTLSCIVIAIGRIIDEVFGPAFGP